MAITAIRLRVDRRTFMRYRRTWTGLATQRSVPVVPVGAVPPPRPPATVQVSGADLLLAVGRACTSLDRRDDPSKLFALLRYATALADGPELRLTDEQYVLDSHKKTVMSDELGAGMAMVAAERTYGQTRWLDFETAERRRLMRTQAKKSRRPDYCGLRRGGSGVVVLEAKGTQSSHSYCRTRQIPSGCEQVARARLSGAWKGVPALRLVVGLSLRREAHVDGSRVYIGDPDEAKGHEFEFLAPPEDAVTRSHYLRVASLVGDARLEGALDGTQDGQSDDDAALERRSIGQHDYFGSSLTIEHGRQSLSVFVGLDGNIRERLLVPDAAPTTAQSEHVDSLVSNLIEGQTEVVSRCEDGTVIQFVLLDGPSVGE